MIFFLGFLGAAFMAVCGMIAAGIAKAITSIIALVMGSMFNTESLTINRITVTIVCLIIMGGSFFIWGPIGLGCAIGYLIFQFMSEND